MSLLEEQEVKFCSTENDSPTILDDILSEIYSHVVSVDVLLLLMISSKSSLITIPKCERLLVGVCSYLAHVGDDWGRKKLLHIAKRADATVNSRILTYKRPMVFSVSMDTHFLDLSIPFHGASNVAISIDWGDGGLLEHVLAVVRARHRYQRSGIYTVRVYPFGNTQGCWLDYLGYISKPNQLSNNLWSRRLRSFESFGSLGVEAIPRLFTLIDSTVMLNCGLDTSCIENMSYLFDDASHFNLPINGWDVSNVRDMRGMFFNAIKFNQPLDNWNVSQVVHVRDMFTNATSFTQSLKTWDTSKMKDFGFISTNRCLVGL